MASASVVSPSEWFAERQVRELASSLGEPESLTARRREAFESYRRLAVEPNPLYRQYSYFSGVDLRRADPAARGPAVRRPKPGPSTVLLLHDASGTHVEVPEELRSAGLSVETVPALLKGPNAESFVGTGNTSHEKFLSLNSALFNRGVRLDVPDDFPTPVRVQDVSVLSRPDQALLVRRVLRAGKRTRVCYSEEVYATEEAREQRLYSSVVHAASGQGAQMVYLTVHVPDERAVSFYGREGVTGPGSHLGWIWSGFGGMRTNYRNDTHLAHPGSEVDDLQTIYGDGSSAFNNYVEITHDSDSTTGQSITRGVFKDHSRGTSRGMMRIQPKTKKVVSYLAEYGMLLSKTARCETTPDLEILSSMDVKATHSSSVSPVDPEKVFYLESRGIDELDATRMITEGFLSAVLDRAPVAGLREVLYPTLDARWNGRPVLWSSEGALPVMPPLSILGWGEVGDWRMDTKLRDTAGRG